MSWLQTFYMDDNLGKIQSLSDINLDASIIRMSGNDPLWLATFIGKHWRWTIPTAATFLMWFASVGGDANKLVQDVQNGASPTDVTRQLPGNPPVDIDNYVSPNIVDENSLGSNPGIELDLRNFEGLDPAFADKVKELVG